MTPEIQSILDQLSQINSELNDIKKNTRQNLAWNSFIAGFLHSIGSFFGYIVLVSALIFLASRFNFAQIIARSFESMMTQVNWQKIIPSPKIQIDTKSFGL